MTAKEGKPRNIPRNTFLEVGGGVLRRSIFLLIMRGTF